MRHVPVDAGGFFSERKDRELASTTYNLLRFSRIDFEQLLYRYRRISFVVAVLWAYTSTPGLKRQMVTTIRGIECGNGKRGFVLCAGFRLAPAEKETISMPDASRATPARRGQNLCFLSLCRVSNSGGKVRGKEIEIKICGSFGRLIDRG